MSAIAYNNQLFKSCIIFSVVGFLNYDKTSPSPTFFKSITLCLREKEVIVSGPQEWVAPLNGSCKSNPLPPSLDLALPFPQPSAGAITDASLSSSAL